MVRAGGVVSSLIEKYEYSLIFCALLCHHMSCMMVLEHFFCMLSLFDASSV